MQQFLQFIILMFIYSSTRFGRPHAHRQELNNCSSSPLVLPSYRGDSRAVVRGRPEREQQHGCHHDTKVKPEVATAVELLTTGVRTPETCWAVNKRQDNKLEKLLHLVGDLFELYDDVRTYKL